MLLAMNGRFRDSSSIANMIPPNGVLKAAATPAAPPAMIRSRVGAIRPRFFPDSMLSTDAPTCTDGPSRPIVAPDNRPPRVSRILPTRMRGDSSARRSLSSSVIDAAMVWGMPLPWVPAKYLRAR